MSDINKSCKTKNYLCQTKQYICQTKKYRKPLSSFAHTVTTVTPWRLAAVCRVFGIGLLRGQRIFVFVLLRLWRAGKLSRTVMTSLKWPTAVKSSAIAFAVTDGRFSRAHREAGGYMWSDDAVFLRWLKFESHSPKNALEMEEGRVWM